MQRVTGIFPFLDLMNSWIDADKVVVLTDTRDGMPTWEVYFTPEVETWVQFTLTSDDAGSGDF